MALSDYKPVPKDAEGFLKHLVCRIMNNIGLKKIREGQKFLEVNSYKDYY